MFSQPLQRASGAYVRGGGAVPRGEQTNVFPRTMSFGSGNQKHWKVKWRTSSANKGENAAVSDCVPCLSGRSKWGARLSAGHERGLACTIRDIQSRSVMEARMEVRGPHNGY